MVLGDVPDVPGGWRRPLSPPFHSRKCAGTYGRGKEPQGKYATTQRALVISCGYAVGKVAAACLRPMFLQHTELFVPLSSNCSLFAETLTLFAMVGL
jgi:hypothetical protein